MKATALLKHQHEEVKELFEKLEKADPPEKLALRDRIADALAAHAAIEQEIFYPAARRALGDDPILHESLEEHGVIEFCLAKFLGATLTRDAETFDARALVLKDNILRHVKEEEGHLFKKVDKALKKDALEELGAQMKRRFEECKAIGHRSLLARDAEQWALSPSETISHHAQV